MTRRARWTQLLIGWIPVWGLFTALIVGAHGVRFHAALLLSLRMIVAAAVLSLGVQWVTKRFPWPGRIEPSFVALHIVCSSVYSVAWLLLNSVIESVIHGALVLSIGPGLAASLAAGVWLYAMIAGISYAMSATARAARAESTAARSQLAALRSQLHPHFLFNALHTVVHLIPVEPRRAALAAEQLAGLLRRAIEEDRDVVPLREEWAFVDDYLTLERIRFGDRLHVRSAIGDDTRDALVPLFALQTLVENAVRHGAAPKVEPTEIVVSAHLEARVLVVTVEDDGIGAAAGTLATTSGTGLARLRERLAVLYGGAARLDVASLAAGGFTAMLRIPQRQADE
jgi:hypothetical protein